MKFKYDLARYKNRTIFCQINEKKDDLAKYKPSVTCKISLYSIISRPLSYLLAYPGSIFFRPSVIIAVPQERARPARARHKVAKAA
jgi:hypothetical protein